MTDPLPSWNEGAAKEAILNFVDQACTPGSSDAVPEAERVAVFDNDGTLWCEKPMPIQLDFILRRLAEMSDNDPALRDRQPWKAAHERDYAWLGQAMVEHYAGADTKVKVLGAGVVAAFANITVEEFEEQSATFLRGTQHPTLDRGYLECAYAPMVELLAHLRVHGFANYIASGGGRDFMRPICDEVYGIPREGVIGSAVALAYTHDEHGGAITRQAAADYLDDGPEKPVHIWNRTGRRPVLAAGNSNGDIEMLDFTQHPSKLSLRLLVLHDDADREFDYVARAERALDRAAGSGWTVVSIKNDWAKVF
jgi:phosphoglycolate phosphatase-like HAD superfamily hydrolase